MRCRVVKLRGRKKYVIASDDRVDDRGLARQAEKGRK